MKPRDYHLHTLHYIPVRLVSLQYDRYRTVIYAFLVILQCADNVLLQLHSADDNELTSLREVLRLLLLLLLGLILQLRVCTWSTADGLSFTNFHMLIMAFNNYIICLFYLTTKESTGHLRCSELTCNYNEIECNKYYYKYEI